MLLLRPFDFSGVEALTFDCYGTLIDWEAGILSVIRPLLERYERPGVPDDEILRLCGEFEAAAQVGGGTRHRDVLRFVLYDFASRFKVALADALPHWKPFPEVDDALARLRQRLRLAVLSNIDDDLFAQAARHFSVPFDEVVTAEQVGTYKPARGHFDEALRRLGLPKEKVVHVGQSRRHDVAPCRALGWRVAWVNRPSARPGSGPTIDDSSVPDLEVSDLMQLARIAVP